jgi:hypothetical protein
VAVGAGGEVEDIEATGGDVGGVLDGDPADRPGGLSEDAGAFGKVAEFGIGGAEEGLGNDTLWHP